MKGYVEIEAPQMRYSDGTPIEVGVKAFRRGKLRILIGQQVMGDVRAGGLLRWHMSISCADRYPTWNEIRDARYALLPDDCTMAMLLPPKTQYVNIHQNCFHLHEIIE
jgi:hypothetical protein